MLSAILSQNFSACIVCKQSYWLQCRGWKVSDEHVCLMTGDSLSHGSEMTIFSLCLSMVEEQRNAGRPFYKGTNLTNDVRTSQRLPLMVLSRLMVRV